MKRFEIRFAAVGGQGIVTAGNLLVDIAVELEDKYALASPTYTATVRGGPTKVDCVFSDQRILFPQASAIDLFICTSQKPYDLYKERIKDDAIVVVDSNLVKELGDTGKWTLYQVPLINETKKHLGNIIMTSVVTLAMTQKLTNIIDYQNMLDFVKAWAPKGTLDVNMKAIEIGRSLV